MKITSGKRWWWWVALVCTIIVVVSIPLSFCWLIRWIPPSSGRYHVDITNGCLQIYYLLPVHTISSTLLLPWYGTFMFEVSPQAVFLNWLPEYYPITPGWFIVFPLHVFLVVLLPIVLYPMLPFVNKRQRRKHGLCVMCAYDLTGNESGTCPECGTEI